MKTKKSYSLAFRMMVAFEAGSVSTDSDDLAEIAKNYGLKPKQVRKWFLKQEKEFQAYRRMMAEDDELDAWRMFFGDKLMQIGRKGKFKR